MGTDFIDQEIKELEEKKEIRVQEISQEEEPIEEIKKNKVAKSIVGIDLGFKQVKGRCGDVQKIFSSIAEEKNADDVTGVKDSSALIEISGKEFRVGAGYFDFNIDKFDSGLDVPKLCYMLALLQDECRFKVVNKLVTGLPISVFNENRQKLTDKCSGRFEFKCNGKEYSINVESVETIPQGVAAYYDYLLDENGEPSSDETKLRIAGNKVAIVDIGGKTTDIAAMDNGDFVQGSHLSSNIAVWDLQARMRRKIQDKLRVSIPTDDLDRVLRDKYAMVKSKRVDVSDLIALAADEMFKKLNADIRTTLIDLDTFAAIILTGGGAKVCEQAARKNLTVDVIVMDNSEFNNVNGYYKVGLTD